MFRPFARLARTFSLALCLFVFGDEPTSFKTSFLFTRNIFLLPPFSSPAFPHPARTQLTRTAACSVPVPSFNYFQLVLVQVNLALNRFVLPVNDISSPLHYFWQTNVIFECKNCSTYWLIFSGILPSDLTRARRLIISSETVLAISLHPFQVMCLMVSQT